jgi:UDPglucose 6-dehydrogenase
MNQGIGFIGQGWIGKNYADDFEARGFNVVRYGLESEYAGNKEAIRGCTIVFIAVPTPTTPEGFDSSALRSSLPLLGKGSIAVLKSTMLPGTTEELQELFPDILVLNSPEFLREANAACDAAHPGRNIIGIPRKEEQYKAAAEKVLSVLPQAPYSKIMSARAAELTKYAGNVFLAMKVVYANILYDFADTLDVEYEDVRDALGADPRIGYSHLQPIDASGHSDKSGRGAGGHCFIKDLEAFRRLHDSVRSDSEGSEVLNALIKKNNRLLLDSGKDLDLLEATYGPQ